MNLDHKHTDSLHNVDFITRTCKKIHFEMYSFTQYWYLWVNIVQSVNHAGRQKRMSRGNVAMRLISVVFSGRRKHRWRQPISCPRRRYIAWFCQIFFKHICSHLCCLQSELLKMSFLSMTGEGKKIRDYCTDTKQISPTCRRYPFQPYCFWYLTIRAVCLIWCTRFWQDTKVFKRFDLIK